MKRFNMINIKKIYLSVATSCIVLGGCTGDFESFNTDPNSAQTMDLTMLITTMEMDAVLPCGGSDTEPVNQYQKAYNLIGDVYSGYMAGTNNWNAGMNTQTYALTATEWSNNAFSVAYTNVMPAWLSLKYAHDKGLLEDHIFAVGEILRVMTLHRMSDIYGPIPVTHFGEAKNPYEAQKDCYMHFFETLDKSIDVLTKQVAGSPDAKPLEKVDVVYGGDYAKWIKLANSVKLRLAMRIVYVDSELARQYATEAIASGVMTSTDDCAQLKSYGSITINNPLATIWDGYKDTRMGASMDSYLNGYKDPRLPKYFQVSKDGKYHGVANGIQNITQEDYLTLSAPNVMENTQISPVRWMMASEVAFLRAEGAIRGWGAAMGGTAESLYKQGIELSFLENGLSAGQAATYAENNTDAPIAFVDASNASAKQNIPALGTIKIKWNDSANSEEQLERIITQKWIAMFPNGQEAWSEFRRTGYPKIFPVRYSASADIDKSVQIRRMVFPKSEYSNNAAAVSRAVSLLGGADLGSTKLWWDKK